MTDKRTTDSTEQRERIDVYLGRSGLADRHPRIVPLTGEQPKSRGGGSAAPSSYSNDLAKAIREEEEALDRDESVPTTPPAPAAPPKRDDSSLPLE